MKSLQCAANGTLVKLNDELFHCAASLLALHAESGAAVGQWWVFSRTNILRGRMREVSLLPSSVRLDLLLSATSFSFCLSSDLQSVRLQAVLWVRVGRTFTKTLFSFTFKYKHGYITNPILYVQMSCTHVNFMHIQSTQAGRWRDPEIFSDLHSCAVPTDRSLRSLMKITFEIMFYNKTTHKPSDIHYMLQ